MATYYVRPDGNNANAGTGSASNQAWETVQYALTNATLTAGVNYIYIAPGVYRESVTLNITPTSSNTLVISGDPNAAQFSGVTQGVVRLTNFVTDNANPTSSRVFLASSKSYFTIENLFIDGFDNGGTLTSGMVEAQSATNVTIRKCSIINTSNASFPAGCYISVASSNTNIVVEQCYFQSSGALMIAMPTSGTVYNPQVSIKNCHMCGRYAGLVIAGSGTIISPSNGINIYNCTIFGIERCIGFGTSNTATPSTLYNSLLIGLPNNTIGISLSHANTLTENFNKIRCATSATNISAFGANTTTAGSYGIDLNYSRIVGLPNLSALQSYYLSPNANAGTSTGAPSTDIYGVTWSGVNPDIGAGTYATPGNVGVYNPTERNASTITIAPGSTSQSIELYLGATGLTASTSGLSARYNRTRTASVSIPLVARTIAQAWTSGGFAEVDATNMPGVYRLDLPDAALAAGADDVTVVVRGASGTNGAVMTINLKSAGLSEAQTAGAVWNAARASYATAGSFGEYVNADLVSEPGVSVHMGPFEIKADGLGASDPLDIQKGAQHGVDIQCVDGNGNGIDITSATVTAKVYNSGGSLVDTYSCTATYAADGRATFTIDTTVTNAPGTYTATITRSTGANDTQVFGPLRIYVRDI